MSKEADTVLYRPDGTHSIEFGDYVLDEDSENEALRERSAMETREQLLAIMVNCDRQFYRAIREGRIDDARNCHSEKATYAGDFFATFDDARNAGGEE